MAARATFSGRKPAQWADLGACVALTLLALVGVLLPAGSGARLALTLPLLLFVPGYLLLQAVLVPAAPASSRLMHAVYAFGLSPALAGLLALATALVPGGFVAGAILAVLVCACFALAAVAGMRRVANPQPSAVLAGEAADSA